MPPPYLDHLLARISAAVDRLSTAPGSVAAAIATAEGLALLRASAAQLEPVSSQQAIELAMAAGALLGAASSARPSTEAIRHEVSRLPPLTLGARPS